MLGEPQARDLFAGTAFIKQPGFAGRTTQGGAELARVPQQPAQRVGGAEHHQRGTCGAGDGAVPRLQAHRQVAADEGPYGRSQAVGDPGGGEGGVDGRNGLGHGVVTGPLG